MPASLLLAWHPAGIAGDRLERFERVASAMPKRVREMAAYDHGSAHSRVRVWTHRLALGAAPAVDPTSGAWLTAIGNPSRADLAGLEGDAVMARLLHDCRDSLDETLAGVSPPFGLVYSGGATAPIHVTVDRCGLQHLYLREEDDGTVWIGSSSLALGEALGATLDEGAVAEWLAAGHFVSQRTFAREVRKLAPGERLEFGAGRCVSKARWRPDGDPAATTDADYRSAFLDALDSCHAAAGTAAELTGGLDSRLVLAGRVERDLPTLSWTLGQPGCDELRVVDRLRSVRGFEHLAVPLNGWLGQALPDLTASMHELADGEVNALEYAPLLVAFALLDRRRRISVSGSGGEIARAYYGAAAPRTAAPGGQVNVDTLVHKLSGATAPLRGAMRADLFPDPAGPLKAAVEGFLDTSPGAGPGAMLDDFYLRARMQRFAGRNITTTGMYCRQALPFFDNRLVEVSFGLPMERKRQGRVVRDALAAWAPDLARVPLDSGVAVAPRSWRSPGAGARWATAMGRKALAVYGGRPGRRLAGSSHEVVPWAAARAEPTFRRFVRDMLPESGCRVHRVLEPGATNRLVEAGLAGGALYPLGLVLTLELTLRRLDIA
jgi:asparagine synthase (glutamine-hydrolysing)